MNPTLPQATSTPTPTPTGAQWDNPQWVMEKRSAAIQAGYKPAEVDKFISDQQSQAATLKLAKAGQLDPANYKSLQTSNPQLAVKIAATGYDPQKLQAQNKAQSDRHDALQTAFASLDGAEQNLVTAGGAKGAIAGKLATLPVVGQYIDPSGASYHNTKIELATQMAKAITGGSRPAQGVIDKYMASLPDVTDTPQYAADKLHKMRNELLTQAKSFKFSDLVDTNPNQQTTKPVSGQDTSNPLYSAVKANPITNFLLGSAANVFQDVGAGAGANKVNSANQQAIDSSKALGDQAMQEPDLAKRAAILKEANQGLPSVSSSAQQTANQFSPDVKTDPITRAAGAATQIATTAEGLANAKGIIQGGGNMLNKVLHPFKTVGDMKAAAIADAAGKTISGDSIVSSLEKVASKVPSTEKDEFTQLLEGAREAYGGKQIPVGDAAGQISHLNDAFNASGKVGKSAKALVEQALGDGFRTELKAVAPDVSKTNQVFRFLYGARKAATRYVPAAAAGGVGTGIGMYALDKVLGKK